VPKANKGYGPEEEAMLYREFLTGTDREASDGMAYAYEKINHLYMTDKLRFKEDCFECFKRNINDFLWVDELDIGGRKAENHCNAGDLISEENAKKEIAEEFGFDLNKIEICGPAYYSCSDLNFIRFIVSSYSWVMEDGQLYSVWW
jgi:hypothetical protein